MSFETQIKRSLTPYLNLPARRCQPKKPTLAATFDPKPKSRGGPKPKPTLYKPDIALADLALPSVEEGSMNNAIDLTDNVNVDDMSREQDTKKKDERPFVYVPSPMNSPRRRAYSPHGRFRSPCARRRYARQVARCMEQDRVQEPGVGSGSWKTLSSGGELSVGCYDVEKETKRGVGNGLERLLRRRKE